jgi:hypothetical protein
VRFTGLLHFIGRVAAVKPSKEACRDQRHQKNAQPQRRHMLGRSRVKFSDAPYQKVADDQVEEAPQHID